MSKKVALLALLVVVVYNSALAFDFSAVCSTGQTLYYTITSSSEVELIAPGGVVYSNSNWAGYDRPTGNITLPSSVSNGGTTYSVTAIAGGTFMFCDMLTSITIPNSIKHIGSWAFANSGITTINYPTTAIWLDEFVFINTPWLNDQPDGLVYIRNTLYCFKGNMPENYSLTIPSNINSIAGRAFSWAYEVGYTNLVSVSIPNSVEYIGMYAFYKCHLNSITLPSSLKAIGEYAFGHNYFTNVTIPSGIVSIGSCAFTQCGSLTTVNFNAQSITDDQQLMSPFYNCPYLTTVNFGNNVHHIPAYLFSGCTSISGALSLPNALLYIGQYAFQGCTGLTGNITIPNSTTEIGQMAFYGCAGITSLSIGSNVNTIGTYAFGNMSNLTTVNYNAVNCANSNYAFETTITTFNIGSTVQTLPDQLIWNCQNLSSVSFPNTLTRIGSMNFYSCGLTGTLTLPSCLTNVGYGACNMNMGITTIQSNAATPPTIETMYGIANAFNNGNYDIPVIVPCGSVSAYQNAPGWSYFTNIQEGSGCTHQISVIANPSNGGSVQGGGTYNSGANCTVTATPNSNYSFVNWTENGTPVSSNTSYSFVVNDDRTLTANFQYQQPSTYTINASANPANGGTISGTGTYTQGQTCTLIASTNSGFVFFNWTENGAQVSTNANYTFTVTGNRNLVANFQAQPQLYTINVSANPSNGGSVSGGGTYQQGQTCTVSATANSGYTFVNWTENGAQVSTNANYSFTVNGNRNLVANFQAQPQQYTINVSASPSYGGSVTGGGAYNQGQSCTVTASANSGYTFINWTENGAQVSTNANYTFTVTGNRNLVAHFTTQNYVITALADPTAGGTVTGSGGYNYGDNCTLSATANAGYTFINWTKNGTQVSTNPTYTFTVTETATYIAHFSALNYTVTTASSPSDGGTTAGGGTYNHGETCTVTASAANGYTFTNWTENGTQVSTNANYSFTVTGNRNLVANFAQNTHTIQASAGANGFITPSGTVTVTHGANQTFAMIPNEGYEVQDVYIDGMPVGPMTSYTFSHVTADHYIHVTFVHVDGLGENNIEVVLYPNPANCSITITGKDLKTVEVYNTIGQKVATAQGKGDTMQIDIANLPAGIYFVNVTDAEGRKCVRRVVKE